MASLLLANLAFAADSAKQTFAYLKVGGLPPDWQMALMAHGDRLQKSGKERLVLIGTVTRKDYPSSPCQITYELPNQVRYQEQGSNAETVIFDGNRLSKGDGNVAKDDTDLIETLVYDSPERFLYSPLNRVPMRKLGSRFRMDGGKGPTYSGPTYDVFQILDQVQQGSKTKTQSKYYHVNSDSQLVERVYYQDADNPKVKVQVFLEDWTTISNNRVPRTIRRLENGLEVFRFSLSSATMGPSVPDGIFQKP